MKKLKSVRQLQYELKRLLEKDSSKITIADSLRCIELKSNILMLKQVLKLIDENYKGNELCDVCAEWFNHWKNDLKKKIKGD